MKRLFYVFACLSVMMLLAGCGASRQLSNSATGKFQYEIEGVSNGTQGSYLVKVWSYSATKNANVEVCKRNAVHGVIFKGYAGSGQVRPQNPLVREPGAEAKYADYFNSFFASGGEFNRYVTVTYGSQEIVKVGKQYKVGLVVSVSKDQLRKALEDAGIIKSLSHGF